MNNPIGVFDSGIGGLTVVRELLRVLPDERIVYFGDTARVPYGSKSTDVIQKFADQIVKFLLSKEVKLIVVACNTVSATALDWLSSRYSLPIIGVIEAGAKRGVKATRNNKIGVIRTRATIGIKAYTTAIHQLRPGIEDHSKSCPLLVPIIEEGGDVELTHLALTRYLLNFKQKDIDTLILGCTHYPLIKDEIQQFMGEDVKLIDSANVVAHEVLNILNNTGIGTSQNINNPKHLFYFSDIPRGFKQLSKRFIGYPISYTKVILG
ncbi:MAG: glutamate racemase [Candidatus Stahlbacteria bacterium]|nr:glutamate racemase [Candidatus Stahlbacteria bacterium]